MMHPKWKWSKIKNLKVNLFEDYMSHALIMSVLEIFQNH